MHVHLYRAIVVGLLLSVSPLFANSFHVGEGYQYATLSQAIPGVGAGDTIYIHEGFYPGGVFIEGLQGREKSPVIIRSWYGDRVVFEGGTEALHLSDVAWLKIIDLEFRGQTGNGVNIDDGGSYDTPSHHVAINYCYFSDMAASGNNDFLKLSGVDSFSVSSCQFSNGARGGSGIDMVGCHAGLISGNGFVQMGSNAIQAKGGTQHIRIEHNFFKDCGERSINLGGSTGLQFFRPIDAPFEAADLQVYANSFIGSTAPIAYVGSLRVDVTNNTIILPENWVIRILQESVDPDRFASCGDNIFRNNIVVLDNRLSREVNIGPNTRAESFLFTHNLWYNLDDPNWQGPALPVNEQGSVISEDPMIVYPTAGCCPFLENSSRAIGAGAEVDQPQYDLLGHEYNSPRSIGAVEGNSPTMVVPLPPLASSTFQLSTYPNPVHDHCVAQLTLTRRSNVTVSLYDLRGSLIDILLDSDMSDGEHRIPIRLPFESGVYSLHVQVGNESQTQFIIQLRGNR